MGYVTASHARETVSMVSTVPTPWPKPRLRPDPGRSGGGGADHRVRVNVYAAPLSAPTLLRRPHFDADASEQRASHFQLCGHRPRSDHRNRSTVLRRDQIDQLVAGRDERLVIRYQIDQHPQHRIAEDCGRRLLAGDAERSLGVGAEVGAQLERGLEVPHLDHERAVEPSRRAQTRPTP